MKIFLGGSIGGNWRQGLINNLNKIGVDYFDPIVEEWTDEDRENEIREKKICTNHLYLINKHQKHYFSIAEMVESSITDSGETFIIIDRDGFDEDRLSSINHVKDMCLNYNCRSFESIGEFLEYINDNDVYANDIRLKDFI